MPPFPDSPKVPYLSNISTIGIAVKKTVLDRLDGMLKVGATAQVRAHLAQRHPVAKVVAALFEVFPILRAAVVQVVLVADLRHAMLRIEGTGHDGVRVLEVDGHVAEV